MEILSIILIIILSTIITINIKDYHPPIARLTNNQSSIEHFANLDGISCDLENHKFSLAGHSIKEGELFEININYSTNVPKSRVRAGTEKDHLIPLKEGQNKLSPIYYTSEGSYLYIEKCYYPGLKYDETDTGSQWASTYFYFTTPSIIDNLYAKIILFLTSCVLIGESLRLFQHFSSSK